MNSSSYLAIWKKESSAVYFHLSKHTLNQLGHLKRCISSHYATEHNNENCLNTTIRSHTNYLGVTPEAPDPSSTDMAWLYAWKVIHGSPFWECKFLEFCSNLILWWPMWSWDGLEASWRTDWIRMENYLKPTELDPFRQIKSYCSSSEAITCTRNAEQLVQQLFSTQDLEVIQAKYESTVSQCCRKVGM